MKPKYKALAFLLLFQFVSPSHQLDSSDNEYIECRLRSQSCYICLKTKPSCHWCREAIYTGDRCGTVEKLLEGNCSTDKILGGPSNAIILQDMDLSDTDGRKEAVQIKPQKIKLRMHEGEKVTFSFKYKAAKNYPIQLYYLMDLTNSMKAHKESLVTIGKDIGDLLKELSDHYQLAFGYYADKVAMPFYKMTPADVENPCRMLYGETCSKGFAFVHAQDFTKDIDVFVNKVKESNFTSNLDDLENGLEPIMQILQCDKHVSWLKASRKMVLMATNSLLHMAGDGILAGVTKKYPGGCLLTPDGVLDDYLAYDYPSLEEVQKALQRKKVQLVLTGAAKSGNEYTTHENYYQSLHSLISPYSVYVNASKIVDTIRKGYEQVTQKIYFTDNNTHSYLNIGFSSNCNESIDTSAYCMDTVTGEEYNFKATVHLGKLPAAHVKEDVIVISESNIHESLEIYIEYVVNNDCDCNDSDYNDCSGHGAFKCGQCECDQTWYSSKTYCSQKCTIDSCRFSNGTYTSTTCNSRGECDFDSCECDCDDGAIGEFCEADYIYCEKDSNGRVCSDNGFCKDGECQCNNGYSGNICDCLSSTKNCYKNEGENVNNVTICSGHGDCLCNKCVCTQGEEIIFDPETQITETKNVTYLGEYCQYCQDCTHTCAKYKVCVTAVVENKGKDAYCHPSFPRLIKDEKREYGEDACIGEYHNVNNQLCSTSFIISGNVILYKDNGCRDAQVAGILIVMPILLILLGGLFALLIWKAIIMRKDKIEYAKFEKDQKSNQFHMNSPIYKNPITEFKNPTHPSNSSFN